MALSGGGIRGIAHAGILKAFEDNDIKIDVIGGTSSGSLVASLYAMGYSPYYIYILFKKYAKDIVEINSTPIITGIGSFMKNKKVSVTGLKTESGKNRVVPLNYKIKDIFHSSVEKGLLKKYKTSDNLYQAWKKEFERLGIGSHTPYDCRHTFATLMDRAKADEHSIKLIMGHRINDLTKRVYTHKLIEDLITEINKI